MARALLMNGTNSGTTCILRVAKIKNSYSSGWPVSPASSSVYSFAAASSAAEGAAAKRKIRARRTR